MYQLPTQDNELKAWSSRTQNAGTQQHASIADVTGVNFAKGDIRIPFLVAGSRWWIPSKSYLRLRLQVTMADGTPIPHNPVEAVPIAPSRGMAACLFQSAEFLVRGVSVSRLTDFVPQVDQYIKRTKMSSAWMENAGNSIDFEEGSFDARSKKWNLPPEHHGLVRYQRLNAADLAANPATNSAIANWTVSVHPAALTVPMLLELSQGIAGGTTTFAPNTLCLQPGDRVVLLPKPVPANGQNYQPLDCVVGSPDPASGPGFYFVTNDASGNALGFPLTSFDDLQVYRPVEIDYEQIDATTFELCWTPPLSIFGISHALPSMSCELKLTGRPGQYYALAALNSQPASIYQAAGPAANVVAFSSVPGPATTYMLNVQSMFLYTYQVDSDRLENGTYLIDLEEPGCSTQLLQQNQGSQLQQFIVPPSTYQLGIAFADNGAGLSTAKPINFFGWYNQSVPGPGLVNYSSHLDLIRLFFQYSNRTAPQPDADPQLNSNPAVGQVQTDFYTQRWLESALATGQFFMPGGPESKLNWMTKGPIHVFPTLRDPTDRSTNVMVNATFQNAPIQAVMMLFSMCRKVATIRVADGAVQEVDVQDQ